LDERKRSLFFVREVLDEGRREIPDRPGMVAIATGQRLVDGGKQRVDLGMLGLHLVEQGEVARAAGHSSLQRGPQVAVLDAVMDKELGLEVLPACADLGDAGFPGGRSRRKPVQVAPEGVVGRVHQGEVDGAGSTLGYVCASHGQILVPVR
jgi:hypothetical protein